MVTINKMSCVICFGGKSKHGIGINEYLYVFSCISCNNIICGKCITYFTRLERIEMNIIITPRTHNAIKQYYSKLHYKWFCSENCFTNYIVELDYHTWNKKPEIIQNIFDTQLIVQNELLKKKIYQYGSDVMIKDLLNIVYEYSKEII